MNVSPQRPFQIVYSLYEHQYLGFLFESFVVELDGTGKLTLRNQNISSANAEEFAQGLNRADFELIRLMDDIQQEAIIKRFYKKKVKPAQFFFKVYDPQKGDKPLQQAIANYIDKRISRIMELLPGKQVFIQGKDGNPTTTPVEIDEEPASVRFHFKRNAENTHYFPTILHRGQKLKFQHEGACVVCNRPAWLLLDNRLYCFKRNVDGKKIRPFLDKWYIAIPRKMEETYFKKFVLQLVEHFDVQAEGFEIKKVAYEPSAMLSFAELQGPAVKNIWGEEEAAEESSDRLVFVLSFGYNGFSFRSDESESNTVRMEKEGDGYTFFKVGRDAEYEEERKNFLVETGLDIRKGKTVVSKAEGFAWLTANKQRLAENGFVLKQQNHGGKEYFLGKPEIDLEIKESQDWFDVHTVVRFGDYSMPFVKLRKYILQGRREFELPDGRAAVIPEAWFAEYGDLFHFMTEHDGRHRLKKHHVSLIQELQNGNLAKVSMTGKLQKLRDFEQIEDMAMPEGFYGELRPYQKAGYNWLSFLDRYRFGGCLADDMGLGKTVQTLAFLQWQKEESPNKGATLLVMPTSLLYNWEKEAAKFTPELKVCSYIGTNREKNVEQFHGCDLVLTSYGVVRIDKDLLKQYHFNYVILDESQAIKNPSSNIAKAVKQLKSNNRLILTGTPLENNTMDLWSQISFVNPGLLGTQTFFKKEYQAPIEKKQDADRSARLHTLIKPFVLRRHKSQVAKELPEKIEKVQFCDMSAEQEKAYEEIKSVYRNKILDQIDSQGVSKSQIMLLQGLTMLRQLANHPKMVQPEYEQTSGKLDDVLHMLEGAISEGHKILVFSQFVKHLQLLKDQLDTRSMGYAYLDGSTKDRRAQVESFQNDEALRVFLISLKAGGVGLNLTAADYVFILDPWWNPAIEAQAIDRAHRIGQENRVFIYKFITRNTVEEKILALQQNKLLLAQKLITTEESFVKNLSREDIESLLD